MALRTSVTERQRRLGSELRRLREHAGITTATASATAGMKAPFLSHIEAGRTAITTERLHTLCELYRCNSDPYVASLIAMSESTGKGWWTPYRGRVTKWALNLAEMEAGAASLHSYEPLVIPGLFQTEDYVRTMFDAVQPVHATTEDAIRFRLDRQKILTGEDAPSVHAVIHEAALRMYFGGPDVMRAQVLHLVELAKLPNVEIQIFPFRARTYAGVSTPFLHAAPPVPELSTVVLEHPAEPIYRESEAHLAQYRTLFDRLKGSALPPIDPSAAPETHAAKDSLALVQHLLYDL